MSGTEINVSYLHINSQPNWGMVTASKHHSKNKKNYLKTNKKKDLLAQSDKVRGRKLNFESFKHYFFGHSQSLTLP